MSNIKKSYNSTFSSLKINNWSIYFDDLKIRQSRANKKTVPDIAVLINTEYQLFLYSNFRGDYEINFMFTLKD